MTRSGWTVAAAIVVCGASISAVFRPAPKLIWNASASVPIGLYAVHPAGALQIGELLVVSPPGPLVAFLDERHYLPKGVPLLKHVAALSGQTVCRTRGTITVDGIVVGIALSRDHLGRLLPTWQGCRALTAGEVFLMNRRANASLDGRYFGSLPTTTIVGRADPIWTEAEPQP
jgi:conjugative transfer signal peptidase TraF